MKRNYLTILLMLVVISAFSQNPVQTTLWDYQTEDFEGATFPPTDWGLYHSAPGTTDWERSATVGGFQNSSSSAFFNNIGATANVYVLRTPSFDFTTAINPTVTFDIAYASDYDASNNSDRFRMYRTLNTNGTSGWATVPNSMYINETLVTAPNQTTYFTPDEVSDWETFTVDLTLYAGESYVRFGFESNPGVYNNVIYIDNVNFFDASPLAVKNEKIIDFSVYPNPSEGNVTLSTTLKNLEKNNLEVRNILGQKFNNFTMTKYSSSSYQLNFDDYKSGMYFLTITSDEKSITKKLYIK